MLLQQAAYFPAVAQVLEQRLALELNQDIDGINTGINQVTQHEIDNAVAAAEGHRRLGSFLGERIEPGAFSSGQYKC